MCEELAIKIRKALEVVLRYGDTGEEYHKQWMVDQMVRILMGCPTILVQYKHPRTGKVHSYKRLGKSEEYRAFVRRFNEGNLPTEVVGVNERYWSEGIAPRR